VKALWDFKAKGRNLLEGGEGYHLREGAFHYKAVFRGEKDDIAPENTSFGDLNIE
jgi:hypothetical protein